MIRILLLCIGLLINFTPANASDASTPAGVGFNIVVSEIQQDGDYVLSQYDGKNGVTIMSGFSNLYFDHYIGDGVGMAVMAISPIMNSQTEFLFTRLIVQTANNAPSAQIQKTWDLLKLKLFDDADLLKSPMATPLSQILCQAFLFLIHKGFEALLIIAALLAYLRRSNNKDKNPVIYLSIGFAIASSVLMAYLLNPALHVIVTNRQAMEGMILLIASCLLFYLGYWLFSKYNTAQDQHEALNNNKKILTSSKIIVLGLIAFLAVYREGTETILYYQILAANIQAAFQTALILTLLAATGGLVLIYWLLQKAIDRIPHSFFISFMVILLLYIALYFIGSAMLELQEAGWIAITPIRWLPALTWLGIYPTWESIGAQLAFLAPVVGLLTWQVSKS